MSTEARFEPPDAALAGHRWRRVADGAEPHPPLVAELYRDVLNAAVPAARPPRAVSLGGHLYVREGTTSEPAGDAALGSNADDRWSREWEPRVERLAGELRALDPARIEPGAWDRTLRSLVEAYADVTRGVRAATVQPVLAATAVFVDAYVARFGAPARADACALLEGFPMRGSQREAAVWQLSRLLRSQGSRLSQTFGPTTGQREYRTRLARLLAEFGDTVDGCRQDAPTWADEPAIVTRLIRAAAARPDSESPAAAEERRLARRLALEERLRGAAPAGEAVAGLLEMLPCAQQLRPALDRRDLGCDQRLAAAARSLWLTVARHLEERRRLAATGDVFYLERAELVQALEGGDVPSAAELERRRVRHAGFRSALPPAFVGAAEPAGGSREA